MFDIIERLHPLGFDFITYERGRKGPGGIEAIGWNAKPKATIAQIRAAWLAKGNCNIGVRLGGWSKIGNRVLVGLDIDIDEADAVADAHGWLDDHLPEWRSTLPLVVSGSGGERRHTYLTLSKAPWKAKTNLARGEGWSIDLRGATEGSGCQNVWPGSLHPVTGLLYRFEREFDVERIAEALDNENTIGGHFPTGLEANAAFEALAFAKMGASRSFDDGEEDPDDDLIGEVLYGPIDISEGDIRATLEELDTAFWRDRDSWLDAGMALHHQFEGAEKGYDLWCEYSKKKAPEKFDARDQRKDWKSFKGGNKARRVRFPTLLDAAKTIRDKRNVAELELLGRGSEPDDDEDLIGDIPLPVAPPDVTKARPEPLPEWRSKLLDFAQEGGLKAHLHNLKAIIANDVRICGIVGYNQFAEKLRLIHEPKRIKKDERREKAPVQIVGWRWKVRDTVNGEPWSDSHDNAIRALIEAPKGQGGYGIKVSDRDLHAAIEQAATENAFHPVRDLLSSLTFDGTERVDTAFIRHLGCPDNVYYREISRLTFVAAVARIFEPGHKFDFAPIIEGLQGKRKSTFIRTLSLGWFNELGSDFSNDQRMVESMQGAWIVEIGELSGFKKHEVQIIKAWFSRQVDRVRMAYGRRVQEFPRQCIFIGSTNDKRYLRDDTGNRRFWPVEAVVGDIDIAKLEIELNQLWAEAVAIYRAMRAKQPHGDLPLYLKGEAAQIAGDMQDSRRVETSDDALMGQIVEWLDTPMKGDGMDGEGEEGQLRDRVCCVQIAVECLGMDRVSYSNNFSLPQKLSGIMARVPGWVTGSRGTRFNGYGQQRSFYRNPIK